MSLRVWLPLNKDLRNLGLFPGSITKKSSYQNPSFNNGAADFTCTVTEIEELSIINYKYTELIIPVTFLANKSNMSICFWINPSSSYIPVFNMFYTTSSEGNGYALQLVINVFRLMNNNNTPILKILKDDGSYFTYSITYTFNKNNWHHVCFTFNQGQLCFYVNGELIDEVSTGASKINEHIETSYIGSCRNDMEALLYGDTNYQTYYQGLMYDYRIYDHTLSQKEVKELSKGLLLHYPCNDTMHEATTNLTIYPSKTGDVPTTIGWDATKHPNAITVSGWTNGYNSGVSSPSIGYHAYWKIIDGISTIVFTDKNTEFGYAHRWLGISGWGLLQTTIVSNTTYTISFEARADDDNMNIQSGLYYKKESSGANNFWDGLVKIPISKEWKRYSYTKTTGTVFNISSIYIYGHYNTVEGTSYVRNIQVEVKDHATAYEHGGESRTLTEILDLSGFDNNATIGGTLPVVIDNDVRYRKCIQFSASYLRLNDVIGTNTEFSISVWVKPTVNLTACIWNGRTTTGKAVAVFYISGGVRFDTDAGIMSSTAKLTVNQWSHIVCTYKNGGLKRIYINNVLDKSGDAGANSHSNTYATIGMSSAGNNRPSGNQFLGYMSDYRIYKTELSAKDVEDLYKDAFIIDNKQNTYCYELIEDDTLNEVDIARNGSVTGKSYAETITSYYDKNGYIEPDGSVWIRIFHHNNPATTSNLFASSDSFTTKVYKNANAWFNMSICDLITQWEFLVRLKLESTSTETAWRWKQPTNPMIATWDQSKLANINKIDGYSSWTANYAGLFRYTSGTTPHGNTYLRQANATSSNWYGATGCWTAYNGGIPGFNGSIVKTGYIDIYLRIDNLEDEVITKLGKTGITSHEIWEI